MKAHAPSRNAALLCLVLFVLGVLGHFVPLGHIAYVGPALRFINHAAVYLLIVGYAVLLAAVYVL
jgi:hypothetical protein